MGFREVRSKEKSLDASKALQKFFFAFDEGYGTAYERYAFDKSVASMIDRYEITDVLEMPADGIMGIPGIKSMIFAKKGCDVTVVHPSQEFLNDARRIWDAFGLEAKFIRSKWISTLFRNGSFDLVWNFCVYEHFYNPTEVVKEMLRVTRKYIFIEIQNVFNLGFPIHRAFHHLRREPWDHGNLNQMKISQLKYVIDRSEAAVIEIGATDMPPWPDINIKAKEMLKKRRKQKKGDAPWNELRPEVEVKTMDKLLGDMNSIREAEGMSVKNEFTLSLFELWYLLMEKKVPLTFKKFFAHHPYIIAEKK